MQTATAILVVAVFLYINRYIVCKTDKQRGEKLMTFAEFFNRNDNPEDITWIIQDNTVNEREIYAGVDVCPADYLKINHYDIYVESGNICIYLSCERM